ncbi:LOW QUALITY PROTEIN: ovochymase-1 [Liasis olivaceus]
MAKFSMKMNGSSNIVSIKLGRSHFCGCSLDDVVVTATRCVVDLDLKVVKNLIVTVGEFNLGRMDEEEQSVPVSEIVVHPDFNRFEYMDLGIALLYLKHHVQYGYEVHPISLPHKEDVFEAGTLCVVSGWSKVSKDEYPGSLSNVLQEVELPILDSITCSELLKALNLSPVQRWMLCAGFPHGGRDACKPYFKLSISSWCIWNLTASEDKIILIEFIKVDIEDQIECDHDYVAFYSSKKELIGSICGDVLPSPLLMSDRAIVIFVSDGSIRGRGFEFTFSALHQASEAGSGCGSIAMLVEEGKIDTANYPGLYPSSTKCHWLIEAPVDCVIKLELEDFEAEISQDCIYDAVVVYGDTEEEHQLAALRGFSIPFPVWSPGNIMLIHFESDKENNFRAFKAKFAFFSSASFKTEYAGLLSVAASEPKDVPCGKQVPRRLMAPLLDFLGNSLNMKGKGKDYWTFGSSPPPIAADICGSPHFGPLRLSTHIIGGEEAYPRHVTLHFLGDYKCGGAIVNPTWVLTAAHCVKIAAVRPVCLPSYVELLPSFVLCTVTGWASFQEVGGLASRLQQMDVPLVANDLCEQKYYFNHPGGITPRMLCAGFASLGGHDPYYTGDTQCGWMFRVSPTGMAKLVLSHLSVVKSENCTMEFFAVYEESQNGRNISASIEFDDLIWVVVFSPLGKLCGVHQPDLTFLSPGPVVKVEFHSTLHGAFAMTYKVPRLQGSKRGSGMKESSDSSQQLSSYRDVILTARERIIQTPGFPNGYSSATRWGCPILDLVPVGVTEIVFPNYPNIYPNLSCTWTIYSASGSKLKSVIRDFCDQCSETRTSRRNAGYNGVVSTIMAGVGIALMSILGVVTPIMWKCPQSGTLCGHKRDLQLFSSSSYLTVHFRTDGSVGARGFKISFEEMNWKCGIPVEEPFSMEAVPANTSLEGQGKVEVFSSNLATPASWPWLVSLQFENKHFCVGILIDKIWVLAAGHCNVNTQMDKVVLEITDLLPSTKGSTRLSVKAVHFHTNFSGFPPRDDISLLELEIPIQTEDTIARIYLPEQGEKMATDAKCLTAGWDITALQPSSES